MENKAILQFRRLGIITITAVYFLILVGGIVRASGAGMGCPDWPTCFGQWIPPTDVSQLPSNYQEIYANRGYENTQFNPVKTWTEYTNRLAGMSIGILIFLTAWSSRIYLKTDKTIFYGALSVFFLVGFQGWLGSQVVASNLKPFMITLHMLLALVIVAMLIWVIARSQRETLVQLDSAPIAKVKNLFIVAMVLTLIQISMGTQVREAVDFIANEHKYIDRQFWRDSFPMIFYIHRSFSALVLLFNLWLGWTITRNLPGDHLIVRCSYGLVITILTAIIAGMSLDRLGFPAFAQPIHLLMANLIFGMQFFIFIGLHYSSKNSA
jgi:cytochrome c oxidase assembly protein subunit 15